MAELFINIFLYVDLTGPSTGICFCKNKHFYLVLKLKTSPNLDEGYLSDVEFKNSFVSYIMYLHKTFQKLRT